MLASLLFNCRNEPEPDSCDSRDIVCVRLLLFVAGSEVWGWGVGPVPFAVMSGGLEAIVVAGILRIGARREIMR